MYVYRAILKHHEGGISDFCSLLKPNETPLPPNEIKQGAKKITSTLRVLMSKITRFTKNIAALSLLVLVSQVNAGTLRPVNVNTENGVYTGWGKHPSKQTSINNAQAKAKQAVLKLAKETCKKVGGKLESYQITYKKNYGYYADPVGPAKANWHHQYEAYLLGVCKTS